MINRKLGFMMALIAAGALGVACGGDDDSTPAIDGSMTTIDSSTPAIDSSTPAVDASTAQDGATSCSPTVTPKEAVAFCTDFGRICGFSAAGYASMSACMTSYSGTNATNQMCRTYHLCNSSLPGGVAGGHCAHAAAAAGNGQCQ